MNFQLVTLQLTSYIALILCYVPEFNDAIDGITRVKQMYKSGDVCEASEGAWMPLPDGVKCGNVDCQWPSQLCVIKKSNDTENLPHILMCANISKACQEILAISFSVPKVETVQIKKIEKDQPLSSPLMIPSQGEAHPAPFQQQAAEFCEDRHEFCCQWAAMGECDRNIFFMRPTCQKSCGTCGCRIETAETCRVYLNIINCRWSQQHNEIEGAAVQSPCKPAGGCNQPQPCKQTSGCSTSGQGQAKPQPCGGGGGSGSGSGGGCQQPQPQPPTYGSGQQGCGDQSSSSSGAGASADCQPQASQQPCQRGIFPAAGGGCGAEQYGGRGGCGDNCGGGGGNGKQAPPPQPAPKPSGYNGQKQTPAAVAQGTGPAPSPTFGGQNGCSDFMQSCAKRETQKACQTSSFVGNMCKQSCGQC